MLAKGDPSQPKPDILEIGIQVNLLVAFPKIKMTLRLSVRIVEVIMHKYWHIKKNYFFYFLCLLLLFWTDGKESIGT